MKTKITQALVERAPIPERGKSILYADSEMRGFYLIVTPTKRSFYVQSLVHGKQVRTKLGDHPAMDAKQARDAARQTLVGMRAGTNPNEERRKARAKGLTLRKALDLHLAAKPLSARTKEDYQYNCEQYLGDWMDKPLADLGSDRSGVRERHVRLTDTHGAPTADTVFRVFRAVYNRGLREHPVLPPNPSANVDYHGLRRRKVDAAARKTEVASRWRNSDFSMQERARFAERETAAPVRQIQDNARDELNRFFKEARPVHAQLMAQRPYYESAAKVLSRAALGTGQRTAYLQQLVYAGPGELGHMGQVAVGTKNVALAAAVLSLLDAKPTKERPFSPAALAAAMELERKSRSTSRSARLACSPS